MTHFGQTPFLRCRRFKGLLRKVTFLRPPFLRCCCHCKSIRCRCKSIQGIVELAIGSEGVLKKLLSSSILLDVVRSIAAVGAIHPELEPGRI